MIKIQDLHFTYDEGDSEVLHGVNLEIEKGSFVAVLGHNGSGKSTLASHLNAILTPTSGKVYINGMDTSDEEMLPDIRSTVGMVFQNPDNQIVASIVEDDVAFAPENMGVEPSEIRRRVDDALKCVRMYEYRGHAPHLLSGGQKQRVAIAGIIAMEPECIVLDEPTAMLDPIGRREVLETIHRLHKEKGMTVILITHHMEECIAADRVIAMSRGNVVMDGTPEEVFSHVEELRSLGLDAPDTVKLCYDLRKQGLDLPLDALTVDKCAEAIAKIFKEGNIA